MIKYSNYLILFILLSIGVLLKDQIDFSTKLLSLFASEDAIEKLEIADELGYLKELHIVVKGLDKESQKKVLEISKKLQTLDSIALVQSSIVPPEKIQNYYKNNYAILASFNDEEQTSKTVRNSLQKLYDSQFTNMFYAAVDKSDPLKLFSLQNKNTIKVSHKGELITLGDYGYLIRASTNILNSQTSEAEPLYKEIHSILDQYEDVSSFAPFYYIVENSTKIKEDVQWILLLSTIVLLIIYYIFLKNIKLLLHTLIALFSSMIFATLATALLFEEFNVLSLAFGMSISAVSIDYLFHYYFHNFYNDNKKIDKNVLYGYLTTVITFGIFSSIPIPIISQISFFALLSLSFAYLLFTFVFPRLNIATFVEQKKIKVSKKIVPAYVFFILSILFFLYSSINITLNSNIRDLDYKNEKLLNLEKLFATHNKTNLTPILVQAQSKNELIDNLHLLHEKLPNTFSLASFVPRKRECLEKKELLKNYDFKRLNRLVNEEADSIGFKEGYFTKSYSFVNDIPSCEVDNFEVFKSYNLSAVKVKDVYYSMAFVNDVSQTNEFSFASSIAAKDIFLKVADQMYKDLKTYSIIVVFVIMTLLFLSVRKNFLYALNYIIFPISLTLMILVSLSEVNLMHIFSLIILTAIGIDFGIYMSNTNKPNNTILAIKYSILSTFGAFGVLIFSSITALSSIGVVISIGVSAIFILTKVMR